MRRSSVAFALLLAMLAPAVPAGADIPVPLSVAKAGDGGGKVTSDLAGIDCGTVCAADHAATDVVTLRATPNATSTFTGWSGDCTGTGPCQVSMDVARTVTARFDRSYRPDGWIKLCGLSDGCTIQGLPNPWKGKDIINTTGKRQTIAVRMEDGEGVRFWMVFENDGVQPDTFIIEGCKGTRRFKINKVQVGFYKRPQAGSILITEDFKRGTATFDVGPSADNDRIKLTLNIIAPTTAEGVTYRCPITVRSQSDPNQTDTLVGRMTTY